MLEAHLGGVLANPGISFLVRDLCLKGPRFLVAGIEALIIRMPDGSGTCSLCGAFCNRARNVKRHLIKVHKF